MIFSTIYTRVANNLRLSVTNTTELTKVKNLINAVYRDIALKADWWWLLKRGVINTAPKITAGTLSVTLGQTLITFSSPPLADQTGNVLIVPGNALDSDAVYRIADNALGGATAHLDAAYTGATNTAAAYRLYQDAYALPSTLVKLLTVKRYGFRLPLQRLGIEDLSTLKLTDQSENKPQMYSVFDASTTGTPTSGRLLQVHPYPDQAYRLEIFYKQSVTGSGGELTNDNDTPLIPDDFIEVLIYGTLARGYAIFLSDMDRSKFFQALFNDVMALMVAQQREYAHDNSGVAPRDGYRRAASRRRSGNVTLGSLFDRYPGDW